MGTISSETWNAGKCETPAFGRFLPVSCSCSMFHEDTLMKRRHLLHSAATATGLTILKSGTLRGQNAPSNKLNIALICVWGRGTAHYNVIRNENIVALCDVNDIRTK